MICHFQYIESVAGWSGNCEVGQVSNDISVLEQTIHTHQTLYEAMCQAYTEVSVTRMSRADLVTFCVAGSLYQQEAAVSARPSCPVDKCRTK